MGSHRAPRTPGTVLRGLLGGALAVAAVVVSAFAITGVPTALVQSIAPTAEVSCADLGDQAAAQALLDADPADPHGLDPDGDGRACDGLYGDDVVVPPSDDPVTVVEQGDPDDSETSTK